MSELVPEIRRFKKAPVIETVLSIQFKPVTGFTVAHFGLYWNQIRQEFPKTEIKAPVMHIKEGFGAGGPRQDKSQYTEWTTDQLIRCWFLEESRSSFVQLQHDRFLYNWQAIRPKDKYPRFPKVRAKFHDEWLRFSNFLQEEKLEHPQVDQCEVTYINHIEYGDGWNSYGELNKVIAPWSGKSSGEFLPTPEKVGLNVQYLLPENKGRLYISLQPVIRMRDDTEVLQLSVTARGAPVSSKIDDVFRWLDLGREWVVKGFTDFITPAMHKHWGREL
jgi:uncharacterized protein (TIGR04255 family)